MLLMLFNICKPKEGRYGQPEYCYEKAIYVVMISFAVVFGLLGFWILKHGLRQLVVVQAYQVYRRELTRHAQSTTAANTERSHHYTKTK